VKFLCEQCKAKYQIADDKVAGKTVRMKCRKCGHMIEVRAEVTESSVSRGLPDGTLPEGGPSAAAAAGSSLPPAAGKPVTKPPMKPAAPRAGSLSTSLNKPPPARAGAPRGPAGSAGLQATSTSGSRPPPSALAGAFNKSVAKDDPSLLDFSGSKEWYVAINGVPVGPVRIAELRRKASLGAVGEDSLVWQEGMEEWRPVKAISDLAVIVREAAQSGRPSLVAPPNYEGRSSYPPGALKPSSRPPPVRGIPPRPPSAPEPFKPAPLAASARSNVVPFAPRTATAEKLEDPDATEAAVTALHANPFGSLTPPPPAVLNPPPAAGAPHSLSAPDPFAVPPPATTSPFGAPALHASQSLNGPFGTTSPSLSDGARSSMAIGPPIIATEPAPQRRREVPWIPIALVVLAASFGITAAIVFFRRPDAAPAPVASAAVSAAPPPSAPSAAPSASASDTVIAEFPSSTPAAPEKGPAVAKAGNSAPKAAPANNGSAPVDLRGLMGGGANGPSTNSGGGGGGGGGGSLSEDQIRSVLNQHSPAVRRSCWERGGSQQSSVAVNTTINVNGAGQVSSVNADGNDPAVAKCIENSIRSWQFPATGGTSTVKIPFKFVRQ
jgi:predicted Zn finger-like uncharacterized protein